MKKKSELYRGKSKTVYSTEDPDLLILKFRNEMSSENGLFTKQFDRKGIINNKFNYFIMQKLAEAGIPTHLEALLSDSESLVKKLEMILIECVIRNRAAGSLVKHMGIKEGIILNPPIFDIFFKNDSMCDPMINDSYCVSFGLARKSDFIKMKQLTYKVNYLLKNLFDKFGFILVDFKLEFGLFKNKVMLGDEFSLDGSRLWDKKTLDKMDKDRFRQNLGKVIENYELVARRLGIRID